jgi:hypothetical protein
MQREFASDFPAFGSGLDISMATDFAALLFAARGCELACCHELCDMRLGESCSAAMPFCAAADGCVVADLCSEAQV